MRQVDAGAEDVAALVFRVLDLAAAQHADFADRIEDRDVGCGLCVGERVVVLGVEVARILDRDDRRLAAPLDAGRAEIDDAVGA